MLIGSKQAPYHCLGKATTDEDESGNKIKYS